MPVSIDEIKSIKSTKTKRKKRTRYSKYRYRSKYPWHGVYRVVAKVNCLYGAYDEETKQYLCNGCVFLQFVEHAKGGSVAYCESHRMPRNVKRSYE